jgi:hypothetical protein
MNETHSGNLNRSKIAATGEEGSCGSKSNDPEATLRKGNLPKSSEVTTLPVEALNKGEAVEEATEQNQSLTSDGKFIQNVVPAGKKFPTTTSSGN